MSDNTKKYVRLPYTKHAKNIGEGEWVAWIEEIPECFETGNTYHVAMFQLIQAFPKFIEKMLEEGRTPPPPKRLIRIPDDDTTENVSPSPPDEIHSVYQSTMFDFFKSEGVSTHGIKQNTIITMRDTELG